MATFQLSVDDLVQMHRELHQQRKAILVSASHHRHGHRARVVLEELQQASLSLEFLLAECDRLSEENQRLRRRAQAA